MKRGIAIIVLLIIYHLTAYAQYNIYVKTDSIVRYYYQLRDDTIKLQDGYNFPNLYPDDPILYNGLVLNKAHTHPVWKKNFTTTITCPVPSTYLHFRFYCRDIDSIQIYLDNIYTTIVIQENGYQIPIISGLQLWNNLTPQCDTLNISGLSIIGFSRNKSYNLTIGDIQLIGSQTVNKASYHPFFDEFLGRNSFDIIPESSFSLSSWPFLYTPFSIYVYLNQMHSNSELIVSVNDTTNKKKLLQDLIYHSLKKYPCYKEYSVDTILLFKRLKSWKSISYSNLIDSSMQLIANIGDPHFFLQRADPPKNSIPIQNKKYNPVQFVILNNQVFVASIQNENIKDIQIGDRLLSYNGIPATSIIKKLSITNDINRLIPVSLKDSTQVTLLRVADTLRTQLIYTSKNKVLYKIPHRKYTYKDDVLYYKLNLWESTEYFHFQNLLLENQSLQNVKCIIFDLRNNGGGDELAAAKIASSFITSPLPYRHNSYTYYNNLTIKDSWVITANPVLNLSNIPVILLTNRYTACVSESFTSFLKHHHNTTIISNDAHTHGAYNLPQRLSIFDDILLDIPYIKSYTSNGSTIENVGIMPDIYVHFKEISDLAAYNDKILETAFQIAKSINQ